MSVVRCFIAARFISLCRCRVEYERGKIRLLGMKTLGPCPDRGKEVSQSAVTCPNCRRKLKEEETAIGKRDRVATTGSF